MKNVKLQQLRFFVAVYEEGSITAAAEKVFATQSGVSVQLRDLEEMLGLVLFDRVPSGVIPTKAGDLIYSRAAKILRAVGQLTEDLGDKSEVLTGAIRVGIMPTFSRTNLAPVLAKFVAEHPLVDVQIVEGYSGALTAKVAAGQLDFAIVPDSDMGKGLRTTFIASDIEVLATRENIEAVKKRVRLAELPSLRLALPGPSNARRAKIDRHLKNYSTTAHSVLEIDSMMATLDLIAAGDWSSILPGCLCLPDFENSDIHHYLIDDPRISLEYLLIESATSDASTAVQLFSDALCENIRESCAKCESHFAIPDGR